MLTLHPPVLHELITLLWAPSVCLSGADGQIRAGGFDGLYSNDLRLLSCLEVELDHAVAAPVGRSVKGGEAATFSAQVSLADDDGDDASLVIHRHRRVGPDGLIERFELVNFGLAPVAVSMLVRAASDLAPMHVVRGGEESPLITPTLVDRSASWMTGEQGARLTADPLPAAMACEDSAVVLSFALDVIPGQPTAVTLHVAGWDDDLESSGRIFLPWAEGSPPALAAPTGRKPAPEPQRCRLLRTSLQDLERMLLADPLDRADAFLAAGSPWYFTLFGRDALWSASLLLPLSRDLAAGTLRALHRRQGMREEAVAEEEPGKILHEVRRETLQVGRMVIPPLYFGTIDATLLWIRLLHDAWRAGMDQAEVRALLPGLRKALEWITAYGDSDGDGFVEYRSSTRGGLANQGWKDTPDAVRWADGRRAESPLALCEVQGYAYAAATRGADLLDAFGQSGADLHRAWAAQLQKRFREFFWIDDAAGTYPAIALDADKRPVDGAASNMAHLLGTGLLSPDETELVARRLAQADLNCGYGLRTLSSTSKAFNPVSYHCGSVWPHDTAIAVLGLAADGHHTVARALAEGVVTAAEQFEFRIPELYAGTSAHDGEPVLAYPNACRPQAWAAAGAVAIVAYLDGWTVASEHHIFRELTSAQTPTSSHPTGPVGPNRKERK